MQPSHLPLRVHSVRTVLVLTLLMGLATVAWGQDSVIVESMRVKRFASAPVHVRLVNSVALGFLSIPLDIRPVTPGSFITGMTLQYDERLNSAFMNVTREVFQADIPAGGQCKYATAALVAEGVHLPVAAPPEGALFRRSADIAIDAMPPGSDVSGSIVLTLDVNDINGVFEIDTTCIDPGTGPSFFGLYQPSGTHVAAAFVKGVITITDTIYVATTGNDNTGNGSAAFPYATIQFAMGKVFSNQIISVGPGTYQGPVDFPTTNKTVRLVSQAGPMATTILGDAISQAPLVYMGTDNPADTQQVIGFTITGNLAGGGILVDLSTRADILDNIISGNGAVDRAGGIEYRGAGGTIAGNWIVGNQGSSAGQAFGGVYIYGGAFVVMADNTIADNASAGNGGASGIGIVDAKSLSSFDNNIVAFNQPDAGFQVLTPPLTKWLYNDLYFSNGDSVSPPAGVDSARNWVSSDPQFPLLNGQTRDYHLVCSSPARNAGRNVSVPLPIVKDVDGHLRIHEGTVDIGAVEFYDTQKLARFTPVDTSACVSSSLSLGFANTSLCIDENWSWDFGDGSGSVSKSPAHGYSNPGTYHVRLIAWGDLDADTATGTVRIVTAVTPSFTASPDSGCAPLKVSFSAPLNSMVDTYRWDFGDGDSAATRTITHEYSKRGAYDVTLKVTNACGTLTKIEPARIHVLDVPDSLTIASTFDNEIGPICNPHDVQFFFTSYPAISLDSARWDFGDNSHATAFSPVHTYADADTFSVQVITYSRCGAKAVARQKYIKLVARPTASVSADPLFVCAAQTAVNFNATITGQIISAAWLFGDSTQFPGTTAQKVYTAIGRYHPVFVMTHACGADTIPLGDSITVSDLPVAGYTASSTSGYEPLTVTFTDTSKNLPTGWTWTFGDKTSSSAQNPAHIYAAGVYSAEMVAANPCGADTAGARTITVGGFQPAAPDSVTSILDTIFYSVHVDTLVRPYDPTTPVYLEARLIPPPRRGTMTFALSPGSGTPPFDATLKCVASRDLAGANYTLELAATDSSRLTKVASRGLRFFGKPAIAIAPNPMAMDSAIVSLTLSRDLTVTNTATSDEGLTIKILGGFDSGPPFRVQSTAVTLAPQEHLSWVVYFEPYAKGDFQGTIRILSDDPGSPDTTITVTGRGIGEQVPPTVTKSTPDSAGELAIDETIDLQFSETVIISGLDSIFSVRSLRDGAHVPGLVRINGQQLGFTPETWFRPDDTLELVLRALVIDTNGNRLDGNHDGNEDGSPVDDYRLLFTTGPGVFPGDANHDGRVDEADILPLGRFWGLHGRPRTPASTDFSMQPAHAWTPREATHADGDGNGVVDANDICPIAEFFSRDTSLAKLQFAAWAAEVRAWPDTILSSLLAALEGCSGSQAGVQALREALTQGHGPAPIPSDFALDQNYPNPFNPSTVIEYSLKSPETVRLEIFDVTGRRVALLDEGPKPVGRHRSVWDGQDDGGQALASGIYFYRLTSPDFRFVRKMVLLR